MILNISLSNYRTNDWISIIGKFQWHFDTNHSKWIKLLHANTYIINCLLDSQIILGLINSQSYAFISDRNSKKGKSV